MSATRSTNKLLSGFRIAWKLVGLAGWLGFMVGVAAAMNVILPLKPFKRRWAMVGFKGCCRIIGLHVKVEGSLSKQRPLLLVTNHCSYLDVYALGGIAPVRFAPKAEIATWPIIGTICRAIDCVFITRTKRALGEAGDALAKALEQHHAVCLFPEGTTSDGKRVMPFKSSLFQVQEAVPDLLIQPARIRYTMVNHLPVDSALLPQLAWYGDMTLWPHLKQVLSLSRIDAEIVFYPPVAAQGQDRKTLARQCEMALSA